LIEKTLKVKFRHFQLSKLLDFLNPLYFATLSGLYGKKREAYFQNLRGLLVIVSKSSLVKKTSMII
jgi:hypothetical protein